LWGQCKRPSKFTRRNKTKKKKKKPKKEIAIEALQRKKSSHQQQRKREESKIGVFFLLVFESFYSDTSEEWLKGDLTAIGDRTLLVIIPRADSPFGGVLFVFRAQRD